MPWPTLTGTRHTRAPAVLASSVVASAEPSSTTKVAVRKPQIASGTEATTAATERSSLKAGMTTTRSTVMALAASAPKAAAASSTTRGESAVSRVTPASPADVPPLLKKRSRRSVDGRMRSEILLPDLGGGGIPWRQIPEAASRSSADGPSEPAGLAYMAAGGSVHAPTGRPSLAASMAAQMRCGESGMSR